MRRYDDLVEVHRGSVPGADGAGVEAPAQFLWHGRLWKVRAVVARWVETRPWWHSSPVRALAGDEVGTDTLPGQRDWDELHADLLAEREVWRVEAGRPGRPAEGMSSGVFDLSYDVADGRWQLVGCQD